MDIQHILATFVLFGTIAVLLLVAGLVVSPQAVQPPENLRDDMAYLESLVRRNPEEDAKSSIQRGNLRFLGVAGYVVHVPGVDTEGLIGCTDILEPVDVIRGTSDVIWGEHHMSLIRRAKTYATSYNQIIAKHRRFKLPEKCGRA